MPPSKQIRVEIKMYLPERGNQCFSRIYVSPTVTVDSMTVRPLSTLITFGIMAWPLALTLKGQIKGQGIISKGRNVCLERLIPRSIDSEHCVLLCGPSIYLFLFFFFNFRSSS